MMRIYKIFGIKQDIDSLETVVDVKKEIDGTLYNQGFLNKKNQQQFQTKILTAHAVGLLLSNLFTGSCL